MKEPRQNSFDVLSISNKTADTVAYPGILLFSVTSFHQIAFYISDMMVSDVDAP